MPLPRKYQIPEGEPGFYHVISRCVRQSFLCGKDLYTGQSFEHRRQWIVNRLRLLTENFAIDIYAYAIMSNHTHLVLFADPEYVDEWDDSEVVNRWRNIFKGATQSPSPEQLVEWRRRLCSVSWFKKCLNEPIARWANQEDRCTGRFWEGRFKSIALLDEPAVLSCMTYVDLNPIRAGMADTPAESDYTSIQQRIMELKKAIQTKTKAIQAKKNENNLNNKNTNYSQPLRPIMGFPKKRLPIKTSQYINLVEYTANPNTENTTNAETLFKRLNINPKSWHVTVRQFRKTFGYIAGNLVAIEEFIKRTNRQRKPRKTEVRLYNKIAEPPNS